MSAPQELGDPPQDVISSLKFSPSGQVLVVGSWNRTVSLYRRTPGASEPFGLDKRIECRAPVLAVTFGADDDHIYAVGLDHDVRDLSSNGSQTDALNQRVLSTHDEPSNKVAYSREHGVLISTSWDGTMHVHTPEDNFYFRVRLAGKPFALALSGDRLVVGMAERKVSVYDLRALKTLVGQAGSTQTGQTILEVAPWQQRESSLKFMMRAIACMPDGSGFATSSIEGRVGVDWFDPEQQKQMYAFKCHRQSSTVVGEDGEEREIDVVYPVNALAFHPVHGTFATGGGDGVVAIWDAQTKRRVRQYQKLAASVAAMDFSPDGQFLAMGISPGFEDGHEEEETDVSLVKVVIRELGENEAKRKEK